MTPPSQTEPALAGTSATARLADVDALRGFALFGILMVNIPFFASGYTLLDVADPARTAWHDHLASDVVQFVFESKFYLLFAFLFGYSFTLQINSAAARGLTFRPRFLRRLGALFLIGVANAVLLFYGDILVTYAVLGLLLFLVRGISPRRALWVAGIITGTIALLFLTVAVLVTVIDGASATATASEQARMLADGRAGTEAMRGGLGSVIGERLSSLGTSFPLILFFQGPLAFSAFLVGLAAGKRRVLAQPAGHERKLRLIQLIGFPVGLAGSLFYTFGGDDNLFAGAAHLVSAPFLTAAYVATLLRVFRTARGARLAEVLAGPGRMALTNYLSQSLLCVLIFTGIGLGLIGRVPYAAVLAIAVAIYSVQLVWSAWWMRRFRMGPVEWLLRAATHLERPAMRLRESPRRSPASV
ncbi:DUF418 domain-containing protein [Streptomyces scopuliridis]|uniref:DUF418 domain-containing protein n=1 Tax=Streptomyces scopuliridis TaxID=452529 RepID=A0ACD4ZMW8_9ACTN|nr:DUF418 domain-containing protein [Streptomyces scopuliridis]WSB35287.1 DUF418 domain-containing protein [Streptomyces scopuliridis]WSB99529.1 DUF418 domain-containing protein [Streptomyces scopuliridis]WSC06771.1 DUF418 domain-containing protein [Streptomyces scopuliridis]